MDQYIERMTAVEDKYALYMELKQYYKAMEMAAKLRDPYKLTEVRVVYCDILLLYCYILYYPAVILYLYSLLY